MRRVIAAAVMGGLVLGGAVATPSVAAARGEGKEPGKVRQAVTAKPGADGKPAAGSKAAGRKTVAFEGYEFQVPASWPGYRLDEHPRTCVRYDVHAVYLGTPGPDMRCPAGLVGQTQTVTFIPGHGAPAGGPARAVTRGPAGPELQRMAAVHGTVTQDTEQHELEVTLSAAAPGTKVVGTYGTDPAAVEQVLNTLQLATRGTAPTVQSAAVVPQRASAAPARAGGAPASGGPAPGAPAVPGPVFTTWHGVPAQWPVQIIQPSLPPRPPGPTPTPKPKPFQPVSGFDTCGAPPVSTMRAWRSSYAAIGIYIGGANVGCAPGSLSASWVQTVSAMGWGMLPTYVGLQSPCWGGRGALIDPGHAVAEGKAAAVDAVSRARAVGLGVGSPIYYDMEAYNGGASCKSAVLSFLGAWDSQVAAAGYVSGVYSSQASGIVDLQAAAVNLPGFTPPAAIWIALWDNVSSLSDGKLTWPLTARAKQFSGNVYQTIGGVSLNIDKDLVGGPLAGGPVVGLPGLLPWSGSGGEPPNLVRVNRRGLISSRHGPTQRPP